MHFRKSQFSIALVWVMIPLTVFGGMPRIGCICANGQHKFFCGRHLNKPGDAQCACCYGRDTTKNAAAGTASCSLGAKTCCGAKRAVPDAKGPAFNTDCPCRPVVDLADVITPAKAVLDLDLTDHMPLLLTPAPSFAIVPGVSFEHARGDLPPPPDLITTLGVLLI